VRAIVAEQAALRRVAELVARETPEVEIFTAIAAETGRLLDADEMWMVRYEGDTEAVVVARTGAHRDILPVGSRSPLGGENVASRVFRTGRPARVDNYEKAGIPVPQLARSMRLCALVGTPLLVRGRVWGTMLAGTFADKRLPPDTESRLGEFTKLMGVAIANAEGRAEVTRLLEEQAALRRVATLVARVTTFGGVREGGL
jgi:GAF domain-containing protein